MRTDFRDSRQPNHARLLIVPRLRGGPAEFQLGDESLIELQLYLRLNVR